MTAIGNAVRAPSNLSSIPPWPGIMLPESVTPKFLLSWDSTRSPQTPKIQIIIPSPTAEQVLTGNISAICNKTAASVAHIIPPQNPIHDFFGDTDGNNLLPNLWPNVEPRQYAPTSVAQRIMNIERRIHPEYSMLPEASSSTIRLHKLIGTAM